MKNINLSLKLDNTCSAKNDSLCISSESKCLEHLNSLNQNYSNQILDDKEFTTPCTVDNELEINKLFNLKPHKTVLCSDVVSKNQNFINHKDHKVELTSLNKVKNDFIISKENSDTSTAFNKDESYFSNTSTLDQSFDEKFALHEKTSLYASTFQRKNLLLIALLFITIGIIFMAVGLFSIFNSSFSLIVEPIIRIALIIWGFFLILCSIVVMGLERKTNKLFNNHKSIDQECNTFCPKTSKFNLAESDYSILESLDTNNFQIFDLSFSSQFNIPTINVVV